MKTPIYDFVKEYSGGGVARFHMPGHKGRGALGCERYDITEIGGADVLYHADGIIAESEESASALFGTDKAGFPQQVQMMADGRLGDGELLGNLSGPLPLILGWGRRDINALMYTLGKLIKLQGSVIKGGGQTETVIYQIFFSCPVTAIHTSNLR